MIKFFKRIYKELKELSSDFSKKIINSVNSYAQYYRDIETYRNWLKTAKIEQVKQLHIKACNANIDLFEAWQNEIKEVTKKKQKNFYEKNISK